MTAPTTTRTVTVGTTDTGDPLTIPLNGGGVIVGGVPGSGKTHLLRRIAARSNASTVTWIDGKRTEPAAALSVVRDVARRTEAGSTDELLILDEAAALLDPQWDEARDLIASVTRLMRRAQRSGLTVVVSTPRPAQLPAELRDHADVRVCFRVTTPEQAWTLVGLDAPDATTLGRGEVVIHSHGGMVTGSVSW